MRNSITQAPVGTNSAALNPNQRSTNGISLHLSKPWTAGICLLGLRLRHVIDASPADRAARADGAGLRHINVIHILQAFKRIFENASQTATVGFDVET